MNTNCAMCGFQINEPAGIFLSSPKTSPAICQGLVERSEVCVDCSYDIGDFIKHKRGNLVCINCKHTGAYHHNSKICVMCGCEGFAR